MHRRVGVVLSLVVLVGLLGVTPRAGADEPDPVTPATDSIYKCLQTARTVSVLFLMDNSGSLNDADKDPQDLRFDALHSSLRGLSSISDDADEPIEVEAAISGFSTNYFAADDVVPWTHITGEDKEEAIQSMVARARELLVPDGWTNFEEALEGAYEDFDPDQRQTDCRIMFWFTDGHFLIGGNADEAARREEDAARERMCTPGTGVVDRLRQAGVVILGLQLGPLSEDLRRMSTGSFLDSTCGTYPIPDDWPAGGYLQTDDATLLNWIFAQIRDQAQGCTPTGDLGGWIDPGIGRMIVRVARAATARPVPNSEQVELIGPAGKSFPVTVPGGSEVGGHIAAGEHDEGQVGVVLSRGEGIATGQWQVVPSFAEQGISFCVWSDLALAHDAAEAPVAEQESTLSIRVLRADGEPADLSQFDDVDVTVRVTNPQGDEITSSSTLDGSSIHTIFAPEATDARVRLRVTVRLTTASGLVLSPLTDDFNVTVVSENLPTIEPANGLNLGRIVGLERADATLTLIGARTGTASVCLSEPGAVSGPVADEQNRLEYAAGCAELQPEERRTVEVSFEPSSQAIGEGRASIGVALVSATVDGQDSVTAELDLPVFWYQTIPVDGAKFGLFAVLAAVLSLALVWLALIAAMYFATKFNTKGLHVATADVRIGRDGVMRADGTNQPLFDAAPRPAPQRNPRRIQVLGMPVTLLAKAPWFFGGTPTFTAEVSADYLIRANSSNVSSPDRRRCAVTPGLGLLLAVTARRHDVALSPREGPVTAQLHLFMTDPSIVMRNGVFSGEAMNQLLKTEMPWLGIVNDWQTYLSPPSSTNPDNNPPRIS